jgi:hypothetical protein
MDLGIRVRVRSKVYLEQEKRWVNPTSLRGFYARGRSPEAPSRSEIWWR